MVQSFTQNGANLERLGARIGGQLRDLREQAGLTQPELANKARVHISQLSRLEHGAQVHLLATHRELLVRALGESVNLLVRMAARATAYYEAEDHALRAAALRWFAVYIGAQVKGKELADPPSVDADLVEEAARGIGLAVPLDEADADELLALFRRVRGGAPRL